LKSNAKSQYSRQEIDTSTGSTDWREALDVNEMSYSIFKEFEIFQRLIEYSSSKLDIPATLVEIARCLGNLCTNKLLRSEIIKGGGISKYLDRLDGLLTIFYRSTIEESLQ